jgi:RNA polymerase sigma factor (sigma-70 family)
MAEPLDSWFKREILAHEAPLVRYLMRVWPKKDDVADLRQETYARVYEAAAQALPASPRAFLFTTAHHLMIDRVRRERIVSIEVTGDIEALNVLQDEISTERRVSAREELTRLARAMDRLPPKCREVMWLRRIEGLTQKEVAAVLGVTVKAIEQHVSKGGRLLAEYMLHEDLQAQESKPAQDAGKIGDHGKL